MATAQKAATIAELADRFRASNAVVLTEYRGLTVKQLTALRSAIRDHATYAVVKNTLTELAAREAGVGAFEGQLAGPSGIAFVTGDAVEAARRLRDFARANPALVLRSGLVEGKALSADDIRRLADLESREVLLARLAGAMTASLSQAASLFAAPLSKAARLVEALRVQVDNDAGGPQGSPTGDAADDAAGSPDAGAAAPPADEAPADADSPPADASGSPS